MTVIAALIHDGKVIMGADDAGTDGSGRRWPNARKVIRLPVGDTEEALYASCGNAGLSTLLRAGTVTVEAVPDDTDEAGYDDWADAVARAITEMAVEAKPPLLDEAGHMEGQALLAFRGRLWGIAEHGAWRLDRFGAIGSGGDLALGALESLASYVGAEWAEPAHAVKAAVEIACRWDIGCHLPAHVHVL